MKNKRQTKILELIELYEIDTQEMLSQKLAECGFPVTQTTVSRDIRELNLIKGTTGRGTYKYTVPAIKKENQTPVLNSAITESVTKIQAAGNIVIVKTLSGMANAIAVCVDAANYPEIVGSVAGDDNILIVATNDETAKTLTEKMKNTFGL